ncbi:MAG: response regulator [Planctomycetota bacterium]
MARHIHALVVEDSTTTRKMTIAALKQAGLAEFTFVEAADGLEALEKFEPGKTQLVFIDLNMPRMGGLALIRELRKRHPGCPPAVMITGESDAKRLQEAMSEPGVAAFLLKPVDRDRLRTGLKTLVDSLPEAQGPCVVPHGECVPAGVQQVLAKACGLTLTPAPVDEAIRHGEVVLSMITLFGDLHWSLGLGFTRAAAGKIAARFAGSPEPLAGLDMGDAIGELTNIVAGRVKLALSARNVAVKFAFPTVISGTGLQLLTQRRLRDAVAYAHFDSPDGKLWTAVTVGLTGGVLL